MSRSFLRREFRCLDDCKPEGCPGHTASIEYLSSSESFIFNDGRSQEFYIQTPELAAFSSMLKELAAYRSEVKL